MFLKVYLALSQGHLPVTFHLSPVLACAHLGLVPTSAHREDCLFNWLHQPTKGEYHIKPGWGCIKLTIPHWKETWCSSKYSLLYREVCVSQIKDWLSFELPLLSSNPE